MPKNKADTVMRIEKSTSQTADQSQFGQTLTSYGSGAYLDPSPETALDGTGGGREITVRFQASNGTGGYLVYHGSKAGAVGFRVYVTGGNLTFTDSSGDLITVALPSASASFEWYQASICTRPWPFTTGASDALLTEVMIHNEAQNTWEIDWVKHAVGSISASDVFSYHGQWNGTYLVGNWGGGFQDARVGGRFKSTTENAIDFSNYTPSTPTTGDNRLDPIPSFDASTNYGDGGTVAGPSYAIAGAQVKASGRRLLSPLVNDQYFNGEWQGWDRRSRTSIVSRDDIWLTTGSGTANPGHGDGFAGSPEVCRTFDSANSQYMEYDGFPNFINDLQGTSDFTISTRIKLDSLSGDMVVCGLTGGAGTTAYHDCAVLTILSTGVIEFTWHQGGGSTLVTVVTSDDSLSTGTWYTIDVTGTINGSNYDIAIYLDGVATDGTGSGAFPTGGSSSTWQVGRRDNNGTASEYFDGSISGVCIRGRAMAANELLSQATRAQGWLYHGNPTDSDDTLAHWEFRRPSDGYMPARAFLDVTLDGNTYKAHLDTLTKRPVPMMCNRFVARVLAGVDSEGTADAVSVAIVATNRQPGKVTIGGPPAKTVYATGTITAARDELLASDLELPRDADGYCWFYLASRINAGSPGDGTAVQMQGCQVVPYSKAVSSSYPLPIGVP